MIQRFVFIGDNNLPRLKNISTSCYFKRDDQNKSLQFVYKNQNLYFDEEPCITHAEDCEGNMNTCRHDWFNQSPDFNTN